MAVRGGLHFPNGPNSRYRSMRLNTKDIMSVASIFIIQDTVGFELSSFLDAQRCAHSPTQASRAHTDSSVCIVCFAGHTAAP